MKRTPLKRRTPLRARRRARAMLPHEIDEQRARLWRAQCDPRHHLAVCPECRRLMSEADWPAPQVAHLIPDTKDNRKEFGDAVIDHDLNKRVVCSLRCNNAIQIQPGSRPVAVAEHVARIRAAIESE